MKKSLILISLFLTFSQADYLNTKTKNRCAYNVVPFQDSRGWCYSSRHNGQTYCDNKLTQDDLINGYIYENGNCNLSSNLALTNLDYETYTSLQALQGSLYGFTLTFMLSFLFILLGRR